MKSTVADSPPAETILSDRAPELYVEIPYIPQRINHGLKSFFEATPTRQRVYLLLLSLGRHHSVRTANAIAFDLFLALIPMLGVAGWGATMLLHTKSGALSTTVFSTIAPSNLNSFLGQHFDALAAAPLAPIAVLAGWWLSSSAFDTMISVFEETYDCAPRNWLEQRLLSLALALFGMVLLGLAGALSVIPAMAPSLVETMVELLAHIGLLHAALILGAYLSLTAFLALIFLTTIHRPKKPRRIWPGAFVASTIGAISTLALGYYATNIARYALFYGGLAIIVIVLLWLWLWSTAILIGAEVNVALEDLKSERPLTVPHTEKS